MSQEYGGSLSPPLSSSQEQCLKDDIKEIPMWSFSSAVSRSDTASDYTSNFECMENLLLDAYPTQPLIPSMGPTPLTTDYPGDYGFNVVFGNQPKKTKTAAWTILQSPLKLFVDKNKNCPISFACTLPPPPGSFIRIIPIYTDPQNILDPVKRCRNHSAADDETNQNTDRAPLDHLIRCARNPLDLFTRVFYQPCPPSGRLSVAVGYKQSEEGSDGMDCFFKFMCLTTCSKKGPISLIFHLEYDGNIIGRKVVPVKISACPGRDMRNEGKKSSVEPPSTESVSSHSPSKKSKLCSKKKSRTLVVEEQDYEAVKEYRDLRVIKRKLTAEEFQELLQRSDNNGSE